MARLSPTWIERLGQYLEVAKQGGLDLLLRGTTRYINFGDVHGETGVGIRFSGGKVQFKHIGDAWVDMGTGGGGGGGDVEFRENAGYVQWRLVGDPNWINLYLIPNGPPGPPGDDGREVQLQNNGTHIQWRYVGDASWTNLVALTAITGPTGATGPAGPAGPAGPEGPPGPPGEDAGDNVAFERLDFLVMTAPATPNPDVMTVYLTGSGTTPNRVLRWVIKDQTGTEVVLSSLIV